MKLKKFLPLLTVIALTGCTGATPLTVAEAKNIYDDLVSNKTSLIDVTSATVEMSIQRRVLTKEVGKEENIQNFSRTYLYAFDFERYYYHKIITDKLAGSFEEVWIYQTDSETIKAMNSNSTQTYSKYDIPDATIKAKVLEDIRISGVSQYIDGETPLTTMNDYLALAQNEGTSYNEEFTNSIVFNSCDVHFFTRGEGSLNAKVKYDADYNVIENKENVDINTILNDNVSFANYRFNSRKLDENVTKVSQNKVVEIKYLANIKTTFSCRVLTPNLDGYTFIE